MIGAFYVVFQGVIPQIVVLLVPQVTMSCSSGLLAFPTTSSITVLIEGIMK